MAIVGGNAKEPTRADVRWAKGIWFTADMEVCTLPGEDGVRMPMKGAHQDGPAPTKWLAAMRGAQGSIEPLG